MITIKKVPITEVKANSTNPRFIKDDKFRKLVQSIKDFPEMLKIRPIVVDGEGFALGGNMRLKACKEAGLEEVYIINADHLTEAQQKEFVIKDNLGYGTWDWEQLNTGDWNLEQLTQWAIDTPGWNLTNDIDPLNLDGLEDLAIPPIPKEEVKVLKLKFTSEEYPIIISSLQELDENLEASILKLLNITPDEAGQY
jgi:hypothetical protein